MIKYKQILGGSLLLAFAGFLLMRRGQQSTPYHSQYDMSTNPNLPRGYRNNNPLNIRYSEQNNWLGKVTPNTDGAFEQFSDMAYGYRAALYLLRKYIRNGENTISRIIQKWAPPAENYTQNYIDHVVAFVRELGYPYITPTTVIEANDAELLQKIAYAMSIVENGTSAETKAAGLPDMNIIKEGWRLL